MPHPSLTSLRDYLALLRKENQIIEIEAEVDPDQEIAEIHRRVIAAGGPALFFKRVAGSPFPVVTNLFGTERRIGLAFGGEPQRVVRQAVDFIQRELPPTIGKIWKARGLLRQMMKLGTRRRKSGPVCEVGSENPRLTQLPHLKLWPEDGGPFVTLGLVHSESPNGGPPNLGIYRMQVYDDRTTGMHWQIGKGGGFHYSEARERGIPLPLTVTIGGPPALIFSALTPLPEGVPEIFFAGFLQGKRLPCVKAPVTGHPVAAEAEFALIGEVPPDETRPEGPFGDHYGYYSLVHDYPVFHCRQILHRRDAVYPATVVGKPCQEDFFLGNYVQELLSPVYPLVMPTVVDFWSYGETGFHSLGGAAVKERYGREAVVSAFRLLGEGQLSLTKFLLVTDRPTDLKDFRGFLELILARCRWESDLFLFSNLSMDTLDYTGPEINKGSKGVLLGLGTPVRTLPATWEGGPPAGCAYATAFCPGCLVVDGPSYGEDSELPKRLAKEASLDGWQLVVLVDDARRTTASSMNFLWTAFTRFEPAADLHPRSTFIRRSHLCHEAPVVLDARVKPWYPKEVFADPDVASLVDKRWGEYFPKNNVEMGSSDWGRLSR